MISEHEFAEVKAQLEEVQRQLWILTQGDNWLKNVKTQPLGTGTGTDHGTLGGKADDDHAQYARTDGTRAITGQQTFNAGAAVTGNITVTGSVDTLTDLAGHTHAGTTNGVKLNAANTHESVSTDTHHAQAHNVASHNDTTATGAELETLTDGSETALHSHAGGGGGGVTTAFAFYMGA